MNVRLPALGLLLLAGLHGLAGQTAYRIGPPPPWVKPLPLPDIGAPASGAVNNGYQLLLDDKQDRVGADGRESYWHIAVRLVDEAAVQQYSQIEIDFDPTYQRVTLHGVRVLRDGRVTDQLQPRRIRVTQQESRADYQIYDGSLSLQLLMEDVRRGDVIEYSYTLHGGNPVFGAHYMRFQPVRTDVPITHFRFRLLWPRDRHLFVWSPDTVPPPAVHADGSTLEYVWEERDVPARVIDANLPAWYDPYPEIELSDFPSWGAVARWGDSLFAIPGVPPVSLAGPLAKIRATNESPERQVLDALRFVQDEVRYLGVEIGVNSHRPYPPGVVMQRRYGDCKDKALLLITMLRALGVAARPVLVSTSYGGHLGDYRPTASLFDHAIVQAEVGGHIYWLDPTAAYQRGDLDNAAALFGAGLVLGGPGDSLSPIPSVSAAFPLTEIVASFDILGGDTAAEMNVDTRYHARAADGMRASIEGATPEELQRRFQHFYADLYPAIHAEARPLVTDNEVGDEIHTLERYEVPEFWHASTQGAGLVATFEPLELTQALPANTGVDRAMPLAIEYPSHLRYTIIARLAGGWNIVPRGETLETPAVRFSRTVAAQGHELTLTYEYEALADHIDANTVSGHLLKMARARKLLAFTITPPFEPQRASLTDPTQLNWPVLLTAVLVLFLSILGVVLIARSRAPAWPRGPATPGGPTGLGGWLVLVGLNTIVAPLSVLYGLFKSAPVYAASSWARLTSPGNASYHPLWAPILLLELVSNIAFVTFGLMLIRLFFDRRRWFPALLILVIGCRALVAMVDQLLAISIPTARDSASQHWGQHLGALAGVLIWTAYLFRSRRVRNTFTRERTPPGDSSMPAPVHETTVSA